MTTPPGWYPSGPEALSWWDGTTWTATVTLHDGEWVPMPAIPRAGERRSRTGVIVGILVAVFVVLPLAMLLLVSVLTESSGRDTTARMTAEMNGWKLPATVIRGTEEDIVDPGNLGATTPSVTRYLRPAEGVTVDQATRDLVAALREQGYELEVHTFDGLPFASGECRSNGAYCDLSIDAYADGRIVVTLDS